MAHITKNNRFVRELLKSPLAIFGLFAMVATCVVAIAAPLLAPLDPGLIDVTKRLTPPAFTDGGSFEHILGTDSLGRDVLSRIIYGSRVSLIIGVSAVALGGVLGVVLGLLSGYFGGIVDDIIMRLADIQMAFPFILIAITILAVMGPGLQNLVIVLGFTGWVTYGRVVRGQIFSLREKEFVESAASIGSSHARIIFKHLLPNTWASVIVITSFAVAHTIIVEASLSFLGLGVKPTVPTWGGMVAEGRDYIVNGWWIVTFPGAAIASAVLGINIFGDWLRDYFDPRLRE
ncbi:MAG: ABC transporter permease [Desulfobacteraceae bacterium]|nr:ABC transporter permease [Desulfobacteraceae bacterium]